MKPTGLLKEYFFKPFREKEENYFISPMRQMLNLMGSV